MTVKPIQKQKQYNMKHAEHYVTIMLHELIFEIEKTMIKKIISYQVNPLTPGPVPVCITDRQPVFPVANRAGSR